jgi:alkylation response protein AidB-like acyl-CoA dehydrogenase
VAAVDLGRTVRRTLTEQALPDLPLPARGDTPARHRALFELGRRDLSLARIGEAHTDAVAILAEAGRAPRPDSCYGVWASDGATSRLTASPLPSGGWRLDGLKRYCSGAGLVHAALVTARAATDADRVLLFEVRMDHPRVRELASDWATPALAEAATGTVEFDAVELEGDSLIGHPDWYLSRPGFWHGAVGPAACWAGGAQYLVDAAADLGRRDPHSRAQVGALKALSWGLSAVLEQAGREIDADPLDRTGDARPRALKVRHLIERWCTEALDRFGRATGPQLLCFDAEVARQHMALGVYIRQCHAERDLDAL